MSFGSASDGQSDSVSSSLLHSPHLENGDSDIHGLTAV